MKLRPYQQSALKALTHHLQTEPTADRPLMVLPTAAGKTVVFAHLIQQLHREDPNRRFLILAHRQELISQAVNKLLEVWPEVPYGIMSASLRRFDDAPVLVASRDTIASEKRLKSLAGIYLTVIDEAHHVGPDGNTRYRKVLNSLLDKAADTRVLGVTATPYRMGQGYIYGDEDHHYFSKVAYEIKLPKLVQQNYLSRLSAFAVSKDAVINAREVKVKFKGGDYSEGELEKVALDDRLVLEIIEDWISKAYTKGRTASVFFCVSVLHAIKMAKTLKDLGVAAACVTGATPNDEREAILRRFNDGEIHALCNVGVLTEGWDAPRTDCIALLRPTKSLGLYVQMCGRGMRPFPGKENCLMLDYGENMIRHGCIDEAVPADEGFQHRIRICPECDAINAYVAKVCCECENVLKRHVSSSYTPLYKEPSVASKNKAGKGYILSDEKDGSVREPSKESISNVYARIHTSKQQNTYCQLVLETGDSFAHRMLPLMFEHPRMKYVTRNRWRRMTGQNPPSSSDEAVARVNQGALKHLTHMLITTEGQYNNVKAVYIDNRRIDL